MYTSLIFYKLTIRLAHHNILRLRNVKVQIQVSMNVQYMSETINQLILKQCDHIPQRESRGKHVHQHTWTMTGHGEAWL